MAGTMQYDEEDVRHALNTPRLIVRLVNGRDAEDLSAYERRNKSRLARWEPRRDPALNDDIAARRLDLDRLREDAVADRAYSFIARESGGRVVARVTLSNIVRGVFQACHIGYAVDGDYEGKGVAFEAVGAVVGFAFDELRLHRVMANYQPENQRSGNLLARLGFDVEGFAKKYMFIDGEWRDHVLTALTDPERENDVP